MTVVLDPVWPWSRLWEVLLTIPLALRGVAALAALLALFLPLISLARTSKPILMSTLLSTLAMSVLLVWRHTWSPVLAWYQGTSSPTLLAYGLTLLTQLGLGVLLLGPPALTGFSVGLYLGTPGISPLRLALVMLLRLLAFLLTLMAIVRPSLGWIDEEKTQSQLYILLDASRSMTVQDERGKVSRWDLLVKSLRAGEPALTRLREEQQVQVKLFRFAEEFQEVSLESLGEPEGKRTDTGLALRSAFDLRDPQVPLRGVLLVSDGADNGSIPALGEAMRWRGTGTALSTFACGNPGTTPRQNDVAITSIATSPTPFVPLKGKLTVVLSIDARGYENTKARVRLFLEGADGEDREVTARDVTLPLTTGNRVELVTDAPATPGEIKVKAVVETSEPDDLPLNNRIETFVTVSKEGISVLLVDRQRAHEPQFLCDALMQDPRIRLTPVWIRGGKPLSGAKLRLLDDQPFDVILIGDVSAEQLRSLDDQAIDKIEKLVAQGAGLMVLGGYTNLGNGGWQGTAFDKLLPVDLSEREQEDRPVRLVPTEDGLNLARYLFRLDDNPDLKRAWNSLARLEGRTVLRLRTPRRGVESVLATTEKGDPLLVMQPYGGKTAAERGAARVLVFGGDTTYRWVRDEESAQFHERFWRQVVVWLARQEDAEGSVWVRPDVRRLPVRSELGFTVGIRGKAGGGDLREGKYEVEVTSPEGSKTQVPLLRSSTQTRGIFAATRTPGVYKITVKGQAADPAGGVVEGEASARVIIYDEDLELSRPAADPEFLKKLASAGGGEALRVEQLTDYLHRLAEEPLEQGKPRMELRPEWRTTTRSPFLIAFLLVFSLILSLEWGLRRRWGMV